MADKSTNKMRAKLDVLATYFWAGGRGQEEAEVRVDGSGRRKAVEGLLEPVEPPRHKVDVIQEDPVPRQSGFREARLRDSVLEEEFGSKQPRLEYGKQSKKWFKNVEGDEQNVT